MMAGARPCPLSWEAMVPPVAVHQDACFFIFLPSLSLGTFPAGTVLTSVPGGSSSWNLLLQEHSTGGRSEILISRVAMVGGVIAQRPHRAPGDIQAAADALLHIPQQSLGSMAQVGQYT